MKTFAIEPLSHQLYKDLQAAIDGKTKPLGALGHLEEIALRVGLIQQTPTPVLRNPHIVIFAADHGIAREGVSAYPQEVTRQMVLNFLNGGAAINVFCRQHGIAVKVVDAGVDYDFPTGLHIIDAKVARGTRNFLAERAMTPDQCTQALDKGAAIVRDIFREGCNVIGFGEMGIGNTSSASVLMSRLCDIPIEECVGRGAGLNDEQLKRKIEVLKTAIEHQNKDVQGVMNLFCAFGGFEIVMMCGAMLQAAELGMIVLVDGFIATTAFLAAHRLYPPVKDFAFFCHQSAEPGHAKILGFLAVRPILDLNMRLGEGTAAALAYPVIKSAVNFLNEMASFEKAGVSKKS